MIETLSGALTSAELRAGILGGTLVLAAGTIARLLWRRPAPVAGLLWTAAASTVLALQHPLPGSIILGLVLLVLAGLVHTRVGANPWLRTLAAGPGAWLVTGERLSSNPGWLPWLLMAAVVVGSPLTATSERDLDRAGIGVVMWTISVAGVYATVPDTEQVLVLLGTAAPVLLLGLLGLNSLGRTGAYPAVGLLVWVAATGGAARPASIVGGLACLGLFWVLPLVHRATPYPSWPVLILTHTGVVAIASRVAGLRTSVTEAAVIATAGLVMGLATLALAERLTAPDTRATAS